MLFELFLSGTWEGIEFGLAIIGFLYLLKIASDIYKEKKEEKRIEEISKKYFQEDELLKDLREYIKEKKTISVEELVDKYKISYARVVSLIEELEKEGNIIVLSK